MENWCSEAIEELEYSIDLVDKISKLYSRIMKQGGTYYQIYVSLIDLREHIVTARMILSKYCT